MNKGRMEAFSDGVIAVIITLMVLELRVPPGSDFAALRADQLRLRWTDLGKSPKKELPRNAFLGSRCT